MPSDSKILFNLWGWLMAPDGSRFRIWDKFKIKITNLVSK
ncbi:hypothetical protein LEP1GSC109_4134 [Leptospira interrogans str. UI 13372]|nr:hypothetical protein LEP1GSC112_2687 [Leptospira interrogans serovar Pomona str. UT364]EMO92804.1 hypothetical protein LEP1GSC109_4134 [Leptospira interrogans str. UI 13372]